jgi:heme/copper-type cytochrome/quinol oxidase subunit 2
VPRLRKGRATPLPPLQGHEASNSVNFTFLVAVVVVLVVVVVVVLVVVTALESVFLMLYIGT